MPEQHREPAYRAAINAANSDLDQICAMIAQLRSRKEQMERAVAALNGLFGSPETVTVSQPTEQTHLSAPIESPVTPISAAWNNYEPSYSYEAQRAAEPAHQPGPEGDLTNHINRALGMFATA